MAPIATARPSARALVAGMAGAHQSRPSWTSERFHGAKARFVTRRRTLPDAFYLGGSRLGWNIVGALSGLLGLAAVVAWVLGSYFKVDVAAMVSFPGADGHCRLPHEGVGVHCWGDFGAVRFASLTGAPLGPEVVYPLSSRILRLPFFAISSIGGYGAGLIAFLVASAACLIAPVVWAVRDTPWALKPVVVTVAAVATMPFLMVLDRGNVLALTVPFLFLALLGLVRDKPWMIAVATIAATSVKPQFALLGVGLLALRHWRAAAVSIAGSVAIIVVPYLVFGDKWRSALVTWLDAAQAWTKSQPLSVDWPGNISLPRVLYLLGHAGPWRHSRLLSTIDDGTYTTASVAILAVIVGILVLSGRHLPPLATGVALLAIASLASPLTYAYYSVFMIPVVAIVFRCGLASWPTDTRWDRTMPRILSAALVLGLSPLLLPLGSSLTAPVAPLLPVLSACAWAAFLAAMAIWGVARMWKEPITTTETATRRTNAAS